MRVQAGQRKSFSGHRAIIPRQMGRLCTVCAHPERGAIDEDLKTDRPLRNIAARFGVSKAALHRHYHHLLAAEALEKSSAQGTVTLPRTESRMTLSFILTTMSRCACVGMMNDRPA